MKKLDLVHLIITVVLLLSAAVLSLLSIPAQNTILLYNILCALARDFLTKSWIFLLP